MPAKKELTIVDFVQVAARALNTGVENINPDIVEYSADFNINTSPLLKTPMRPHSEMKTGHRAVIIGIDLAKSGIPAKDITKDEDTGLETYQVPAGYKMTSFGKAVAQSMVAVTYEGYYEKKGGKQYDITVKLHDGREYADKLANAVTAKTFAFGK